MAAERRRGKSTGKYHRTNPVHARRRQLAALKEAQIPVWWPEMTRLIQDADEAERALRTARRRIDLAVWYILTHKRTTGAWLARRLGVSEGRVWFLAKRGEAYVTMRKMSPESVATLLFTPAEKREARRAKVARHRAQAFRATLWWSAPPPSGRPLPSVEERDPNP